LSLEEAQQIEAILDLIEAGTAVLAGRRTA